MRKNASERSRSRVGVKDVAAHAGVAVSSVSRVLAGHPDVSPAMRDRVLRAVDALDYTPNAFAQGLRTRRSMTIGFTVSDIANPVLALAVTGAERKLRNAGYSVLLTNSEGNAALDSEQIRVLQQRRVDGLILALADETYPETQAMLRDLAIPAVLIDRDAPKGLEVRAVRFDHARGMEQAARHLLALGHQKFGVISGGPKAPARARLRGIQRALRGTQATVNVVEKGFSVEAGARAMHELLDTGAGVTAVIAAGNMLMQGALWTLHQRSVDVGRELSFVGCDDIAIAEIHVPPIAVVTRDMLEVGEVAADLLLAALREEVTRKDVVLQTEFVPRASCAPPPPAHR